MDCITSRCRLHQPLPMLGFCFQGVDCKSVHWRRPLNLSVVYAKLHIDTSAHRKNPPKYLRYPRRTRLPPDSGISKFVKLGNDVKDHSESDIKIDEKSDDPADRGGFDVEKDDEIEEEDENDDAWEADEIEAISSLFRGRIPQKPGKLNRERPLPLPVPHKLRPLRFPTVKRQVRTPLSPTVVSRQSLSQQIYKDPLFLVNLAREIRSLPVEEDVCSVLDKWGRFLRKGSLSLTIRELGHIGLPQRALQTFCWAQKQTHLYPDDRILAATVEILARSHELKLPFELEKFVSLASRGVLEAIARGFIKSRQLNLAWRLLYAARKGKRMLDSNIHAKLILELGKNPDKDSFVIALLEELGERDSLNLSWQDCSAVMKVCVRLGKFEIVECLFDWFKKSGNQPSLVMYTTMIHSRLSAMNYREAMTLVWEMEGLDFLFDLPSYRVVIKLFVALNDLPKAARYFSKMKEAGFVPTYDLYRDMVSIYLVSGRLAKCKEIYKELKLAGYELDSTLRSEFSQLEKSSGQRLGSILKHKLHMEAETG